MSQLCHLRTGYVTQQHTAPAKKSGSGSTTLGTGKQIQLDRTARSEAACLVTLHNEVYGLEEVGLGVEGL